jgi:hypothetical protein
MFHVDATRPYFGVSLDEMAFSRFRAVRAARAAGFEQASARPFDFLHPAVPAALVTAVSRAGTLLERIPLVREFGGSLLIRATRP